MLQLIRAPNTCIHSHAHYPIFSKSSPSWATRFCSPARVWVHLSSVNPPWRESTFTEALSLSLPLSLSLSVCLCLSFSQSLSVSLCARARKNSCKSAQPLYTRTCRQIFQRPRREGADFPFLRIARTLVRTPVSLPCATPSCYRAKKDVNHKPSRPTILQIELHHRCMNNPRASCHE